MKSIDAAIAGIPRRHHSVLPTPVHELTALSGQFGCRVFCKRDDLTGFGFGGNKSRKLDFLVDDAITRQCDTLLTVGANQSNFCRMVAAYGSVNEMDVHLILGGEKPDVSTGNLRLDHMLRAHCHHVDSNEWDVWESEARSLEMKLTKDGHRVYQMPVGGSTPIGALGYVAAMSEIIDDETRLGVHFDAIVFASSSAGTQAGLVVGKSISKWPGKILGMSVAKDKNHQYQDVVKLAAKTAEIAGATIDPETVIVDDAYLGAGYACRTKACEEAVQLFAGKCGIFLDYVYTGKAAAGLIDYLKTGRFEKGSCILFIHTGGNLELFE